MTGTARYEATKIPEAIKYPRELSLSGPWPGAHGAHLTFVASEDFRQTAMVVPSLTPSMTKAELRSAMRAARKSFVASLSHSQRLELETRLAEHLDALVSQAKIVGSYHPHGSEIDPAGALQGADAAYPSFDPGEEKFTYRTGECVEAGPHKIMQPTCANPAVMPDLLLVPLIAIDPRGYRLGQGGGHYDRVLPAMRAAGAMLIGVGWELQRLDFPLPHESWDVPLDGFASPRGLEMFR